MSAPWIISVLFAVATVGLPLWIAWLWLARSWEVLDDDQLTERLSSRTQQSPPAGLRMLGWFTARPRRLTYRRDERGRFRKVRR